MEYFSYDFPMSGVMVGSMIPGIRSLVQTMKVSTFLDGTNHPLIKTRQARPDVLQSGYPQMHGPHTQKEGIMEKLKALLGGKDKPRLQEGYEALAENRDWRK